MYEIPTFRKGVIYMLTEIRSRSQITIPSEIIKKLNLKQGDTLEVEVEGDQIVLRPVVTIPKDQAYFWTKEWQNEERQVQSDVENDKIKSAKSKDELFKDLGYEILLFRSLQRKSTTITPKCQKGLKKQA